MNPAPRLPQRLPVEALPRDAGGGPGLTPLTRRPYGIAPPVGMGGRKYRFLTFGIPYVIFNGLGAASIFLAIGLLADTSPQDAVRNPASLSSLLADDVGVLLAIGLLLGAYVGTAGVLCFMGKVVGWWMGIVHIGLGVAMQVFGIVENSPRGERIGLNFMSLVFSGLLVFLAVLDYRKYRASKMSVQRGAKHRHPHRRLPGNPAARAPTEPQQTETAARLPTQRKTPGQL